MPASRFETPRKYPCASTLRSNSFIFTHFRKNASATSLVSHTFKRKDLKPFRFTHFQKNGRGRVLPSNIQPQTSNLRSSLNPLTSTLTKKGGGGGGYTPFDSQLSTVNYAPHWGYLSRITSHHSLPSVATPRPLCHNRLLCQRKPLRAS